MRWPWKRPGPDHDLQTRDPPILLFVTVLLDPMCPFRPAFVECEPARDATADAAGRTLNECVPTIEPKRVSLIVAPADLMEVDEVGIGLLGPAPRGLVELPREDRDGPGRWRP
jgi:hypothetical protein